MTFHCGKCGADIKIRYLKAGESAKCKICGAINIVPQSEMKRGVVIDENIAVEKKELTSDEKRAIKNHWLPKAYWALAYIVLYMYLFGRNDLGGMPPIVEQILENGIFKLIFGGLAPTVAFIIWAWINLKVHYKCTGKSFLFSLPSRDVIDDLRYAKPLLYLVPFIILSEILLFIYNAI
ncbi:MAG: hypothetical protein HRF51_06255 [bacterium]|jgi:hypothetical protein